jgi:hypothetical protein
MTPVRIRRLAAELQMRRRRLDFYQRSQPWRGKDVAWRFELVRYDQHLLVAAEMLEVSAPKLAARSTLAPEQRAALEDRLAVAGLDVFAPRSGVTGDVLEDGDLNI